MFWANYLAFQVSLKGYDMRPCMGVSKNCGGSFFGGPDTGDPRGTIHGIDGSSFALRVDVIWQVLLNAKLLGLFSDPIRDYWAF